MKGELGFLLPMTSSCVSSERGGFGSPTRASSLEKSPNSPSSCVSDGREDDGGFSSSIWESQLEVLLDSPSSRVPSGRGSGGFRSPAWESPMETLLDPPSTCAPNGFDGGNGGYSSLLGISGEKGCEAERLLRAIVERYDDCFNRLRDATAELADLRRERLRLSAENLHLSLLLEDLEYEQRKQASAAALTLSPKRAEEDAARGGAPKSISIRSKDFLSQKQPQGEGDPQRLRVRASPAMEEAGEKGDGELEVEVEAYRQGAAKTELCNKWERGLPCPYGGRCRFAHGPQELRPVIRHPRYKTLACQMFAAASGCPYGHRCHFRHSHSQSPPPLPVAETH